MQAVFIQGWGQSAPDLAQQLRVVFDRGGITGDFFFVPQEAADVLKVFGHERECGSN